jgi:hypothetical protein
MVILVGIGSVTSKLDDSKHFKTFQNQDMTLPNVSLNRQRGDSLGTRIEGEGESP